MPLHIFMTTQPPVACIWDRVHKRPSEVKQLLDWCLSQRGEHQDFCTPQRRDWEAAASGSQKWLIHQNCTSQLLHVGVQPPEPWGGKFLGPKPPQLRAVMLHGSHTQPVLRTSSHSPDTWFVHTWTLPAPSHFCLINIYSFSTVPPKCHSLQDILPETSSRYPFQFSASLSLRFS